MATAAHPGPRTVTRPLVKTAENHSAASTLVSANARRVVNIAMARPITASCKLTSVELAPIRHMSEMLSPNHSVPSVAPSQLPTNTRSCGSSVSDIRAVAKAAILASR